MGHEHHGGAGVPPDAEQLALEVLPRHLVECAERLVHQEQLGAAGQGAGDGDALLHAAGELPGEPAGDVAEADEVQHGLGLPPALRPGHAADLEREFDIAPDGAPVQQAGLLEDEAVVPREARLARAPAADGDGARGGGGEVGDDPQQGALAAAAGAEQGDERAGAHVEPDPFQGGDGLAAGGGEDLVDVGERDGGRVVGGCHGGGTSRCGGGGGGHPAVLRFRRDSDSPTRRTWTRTMPVTAATRTAA